MGDMCNKFIISPISLLSATYLLCICSMEIADARLLMIPHERHSNQNELTMNDNIEKSQKLTMPRVDEGNAHIRSLPVRVCKIKLPSSDQLQKIKSLGQVMISMMQVSGAKDFQMSLLMLN